MIGVEMPRSKKVSERMRAESRAKILAAARRLFAQQGYFKCKVSDIAREAEMSQGNVYWYFSSKEHLLKAVLKDGFEALGADVKEAHTHPGTGAEKLALLVDLYVTFAQERGDFTSILMSLMAHGGVPFLQELGFDTLQIGAGYHQHVSAILAQARAEGSVTDIDPNMLTLFFFAFFNGLIITYGKDWMTLPPELIRDAALRLLGSDTK